MTLLTLVAALWATHGNPLLVILPALATGMLSFLVAECFVVRHGRSASADVNPHVGERDRMKALRERAETRRTRIRCARDSAYEVSAGGIVRHLIGTGQERKVFPVRAIVTVDVEDVAPGHVTVTAMTLVGKVTVPWLARTHDLMSLVDKWRTAASVHASVLEGPQ